MKILLINTSDLQGGAAIACFRLAKALQKVPSLDVKMLVKEKTTDEDFVVGTNTSLFGLYKGQLNFALEKATFLPYEKSKAIRFLFSSANFGQDISKLPEVQEADIIHLHWVNKGFLSLKSLEQLMQLGKPIVWTLHDMWPFTGGCHYAGDCLHFQKRCGDCRFLKNPKSQDISNKIWGKKKNIYQSAQLNIVTCSGWLKEVAKTSSLLTNVSVQNIPNTIDIDTFKPIANLKTKEKYTILFQAMNINDQRKGLKYFLEALAHLKKEHITIADKIELLIFGKDTSGALDGLNYPAKYLGVLKDQSEIARAYNQSDIFVIPSLEDNLPNTIMESLACGVPVVGFETVGIPEMVDHHKNGFIAPQKDAQALAEGIKWVLEDEERYTKLSQQAVKKVKDVYSHQKVSNEYLQLYTSILSSQPDKALNK